MSNSNSEGFDLARLTIAGWLLSLFSLIVFFICTAILLNLVDNSGGDRRYSDGEMQIMSLICFGCAATFFIAGKFLLEYLGLTVIKAPKNRQLKIKKAKEKIRLNNIKRNSNQLKIKVKPFTNWFFASAQLIIGSAFIYIFTIPGSSKIASLLLGIFLLALSTWTFITSFTSLVSLNKKTDKLLLACSNPFWQDKKEFKLRDITEIKLSKFGSHGEFCEIMVQLNNQNWISLLPSSTNEAKYRQTIHIMINFLNY